MASRLSKEFSLKDGRNGTTMHKPSAKCMTTSLDDEPCTNLIRLSHAFTPRTKVGYVLRLEGGRFYVGSTSRPEERIKEHCRAADAGFLGATFTRLYRPIAEPEYFQIDCMGDETAKVGMEAEWHQQLNH
eukprot:1161400-Pelagomonas_calceolata.AAC.4